MFGGNKEINVSNDIEDVNSKKEDTSIFKKNEKNLKSLIYKLKTEMKK